MTGKVLKGYKIIYSNEADSLNKRAASQLHFYLKQMSKAKIPLVKEGRYNTSLKR
ncbi:MAG: hypothetical protein V5A47_12605 [Bacteroidales bacterium]|nr:hypothetical protein [Bacteroidales bacterium]